MQDFITCLDFYPVKMGSYWGGGEFKQFSFFSSVENGLEKAGKEAGREMVWTQGCRH